MNNNLISDIGFHKGEDTIYYLYRGYNVIAVDADYNLVKKGCEKFSKEINSGQLIIKHCVISSKDNEKTTFYLSKNSVWNSSHKEVAERQCMTPIKTIVHSCTLNSLMEQFGVPYYFPNSSGSFGDDLNGVWVDYATANHLLNFIVLLNEH